ncbi:cytochrome c3 family protein [Shimia ponticola]|uniref:cytochrome c3 family protein n=1 Tax=Shimia ponticola TaxID=2582893 RepID=UPI0011BEF888|nr:cytochrome c3 family protein [Shimia ponticola]
MPRLSAGLIRRLALLTLVPMAALSTAALTMPQAMTLISHGPIQKGHADVGCSGCHEASIGSIRQQTQANLRHLVGLRETPADFGYGPVTSRQCIACHDRPNDRHPIYRFQEPRFQDALKEVGATSCLGCHSEHKAERVQVEPTICVACHEDLDVRNDPIDVPHVALISDKRWDTCLGCHDFHGNHARKAQKTLALAHEPAVIRAYLKQGPNPYGATKSYPAQAEKANQP